MTIPLLEGWLGIDDAASISLMSQSLVGNAKLVGLSETQSNSDASGVNNQGNGSRESGSVSAEVNGVGISNSKGADRTENTGASTNNGNTTTIQSYVYDVIISRVYRVDFHGRGLFDMFRSKSKEITVTTTARITVSAPFVQQK